jgi:Heterokaryon incompatibility protein (HET)
MTRKLSALPDHPTEWLWADAICINQSDDIEKAHQVPLMRDIYGTAKEVSVHLGESASAWNVLLTMATAAQIIGTSSHFMTQPSQEVQDNLSKLDLSAVAEFFISPAFQRSWMIQEMVLGKKVDLWYGEAQFDLQQIATFVAFLGNTNLTKIERRQMSLTETQLREMSLGIYHADNLCKVKTGWVAGDPKSFIGVLRRFRGAKATDLRDKVYSLLGLADDHYFNNIVPDYSKTTTTADFFIQVANLAVTAPSRRDIAILLYSGGIHLAESTIGKSLPSWVPDFSVLPQYPIDPSFYSCAANSKLSVKLEGSARPSRFLSIRGAIIDSP